MRAYTISKLARDAGVSVHIVRDYMLRGLLSPIDRTNGGYAVFGTACLERLRFLRTAVESGIGLDELARLYRALESGRSEARAQCESLKRIVARQQRKLDTLQRDLDHLSARLEEKVS